MSTHMRKSGDPVSRRDLARLAMAGLAAPLFGAFGGGRPASDAAPGGVRLGVHTSSFRDLPDRPGGDSLDAMIQAMTECEVRECELFAPLVEPAYGGRAMRHHAMSSMSPQMMRRELRKWRLRTSLAHFTAIGSRLQKSGVSVYAYNYSPDSTFSDQEIDRGFSMAKTLGAEIITAAMTLEDAKRVAPFAGQHRMIVALTISSSHTGTNPPADPAELDAALALSPYYRANVDLAQFTAGNVDPVAYIRAHHADIAIVHLNDCRRNSGDAVAWGEGDSPIREVLQLLKQERWPIRAYVDYQYRGDGTPVEEVRKCLASAKRVIV